MLFFNDVVIIKRGKKNHVLTFHLKNFMMKKMTKDIVIMIPIIIHDYPNKKIIYKGEILKKG
jgi:hypothetical protein